METAKAGIYGDYALRNTSDLYKRKYFSTVDQKKLQVRPEVKKLITISRLNLQDDSKMPLLRAPQGRPDRRPGMAILLQEHRDLEGVDLARFTFELDEAVEEIQALVATVFGSAPAPACA